MFIFHPMVSVTVFIVSRGSHWPDAYFSMCDIKSLSIDDHFPFPFQLSVSAFRSRFPFPPFPLARKVKWKTRTQADADSDTDSDVGRGRRTRTRTRKAQIFVTLLCQHDDPFRRFETCQLGVEQRGPFLSYYSVRVDLVSNCVYNKLCITVDSGC